MPTITTRAGKGADLTPSEADANFKRPVSQKTAAYTCLGSDNRSIIECNNVSGFTVTLGDAATMVTEDTGDYEVTVMNVGSGTITVSRAGSDTIDGETSVTLAQYHGITLAVNGDADGYISTARIGKHKDTVVDNLTIGGTILSIGADVVDASEGGQIDFARPTGTSGTGDFSFDVNGSNFRMFADVGSGTQVLTFPFPSSGNASVLNSSDTLAQSDACLVTIASGGTLTGTLTAIAWDTEVYDDNSMHDNATNNTRLTVPSGVTRVRLSFQMESNIPAYTSGDCTHTAVLRKNGSASSFDGQAIDTIFNENHISHNQRLHFSTVLSVTGGDYFEVFASSSVASTTYITDVSWFLMEVIK